MKVNMNNMLLLLGIYIYCGKLNTRNLTIQLHISNTTLIEKVVNVLDEMSMIYKVETSGKVIIDNENLYTHFYQIQYKKKLPKYVGK